MKKSDLIDAMLAQDEKEKQEVAQAEAKEEVKESFKEKKEETDVEQLDSGKVANGILEEMCIRDRFWCERTFRSIWCG